VQREAFKKTPIYRNRFKSAFNVRSMKAFNTPTLLTCNQRRYGCVRCRQRKTVDKEGQSFTGTNSIALCEAKEANCKKKSYQGYTERGKTERRQ
jgi:transposase